MNVENVKKAIAIMQRVVDRGDKLNLDIWQERKGETLETEEELHTCGTAACFAGWIAVSPEFKADSGYTGHSGAPVLESVSSNYPLIGEEAIAEWLGITETQAEHLCGLTHNFYIRYDDPQEVIERLNELLTKEHLSWED